MNLQKETILSYNNFQLLSEDIITLAKQVMPDKVIYINFLNNDVQVTMKVSKNDTLVNVVEGETIPVHKAVCNNIDYSGNKPLVINDTKEHSLGEVVDETIKNGNLGSYLGIPILFKNGKRFGALCAAHHDKSSFNEEDIQLLQNIANLFSYYLELERLAFNDVLTGLNNKQFLNNIEKNIINDGGLFIMLDLDNFKQVNDTKGHNTGDLVLKELANKIKEFSKNFNDVTLVRLGGDEFVIYIKDELKEDDIRNHLSNLIKLLNNWNTDIGDVILSSSLGAIYYNNGQFKLYKDLYKSVDKLLYEAKQAGKNRYVLSYEG